MPSPQADLWRTPGIFATSLLLLWTDRYGTESLNWAPETYTLQLRADVGEIPRQNLDRLQAARMLVTGGEFYTSTPVFNELCLVLSGDDFNPHVFRPASVADMAWGITESVLISPPDSSEPFSEEIRHYVGAAIKNEGLVRAPAALSVAILDPVSVANAQEWFSDTELGAGIEQDHEANVTAIDDAIRDCLERLLTQIRSLPLQHGNSQDLQKRLRAEIRPPERKELF